jgi:hypothetical protein
MPAAPDGERIATSAMSTATPTSSQMPSAGEDTDHGDQAAIQTWQVLLTLTFATSRAAVFRHGWRSWVAEKAARRGRHADDGLTAPGNPRRRTIFTALRRTFDAPTGDTAVWAARFSLRNLATTVPAAGTNQSPL